LPVTVLKHVDAVCRRFEDAWRQGRTPSLEEHLAGAGAAERAALLRELLWVELQYRGTADAAEYETRFPEEAAVVRSVFAQLATVPPGAPGGRRPAGADDPTPSSPPDGLSVGDAASTCPDPRRGTANPQSAAARFPAPPGYEVLGELGRGGMGVVYKARQLKANRVVALKMTLGGRPPDLAERVRFQIEVEAIARLRHAHIVQLLEAGEYNGQPYFSLEFCDGGSLDRALKARRPSADEAAALVEKLARAVHSAHQRGVVHRDLKPANVLLTEEGEPKVSDFGLAKRTDTDGNVSQSGAVIGTPSYMAPEQAEGKGREVGPATDVYALGAILYECFAGRPPFKGETAFDTVRRVLTEEPEPPSRLNPRVPSDLETICLKCLRKQPAERYGSAEELAEDLRRYREGEPIAARPAGVAERALKWARRRPAVASLVALAVVLVCVVIASLGLISSHQHNEIVALVQKEQEHQEREKAEQERWKAQQERTLARINALADAAPGAVPGLLAELDATRDEAVPRLWELWSDGDNGLAGSRARRMRFGLALLPVVPERVHEDLADWLPQISNPAEVVLFRDVLTPYTSELRERFWAKAGDAAAKPEERFRALVALAAFDSGDKRWGAQARNAVEMLLAENPLHLGTWVPALRPVADSLLPPLAEEYRTARSPERREYAATVLADYAADQPETLADLLLDADTPGQYDRLFPAVRRHAEPAAARVRDELAIPTPDPDAPITPKGVAERERLARRQATGAVTLLKLGAADGAWHVFRLRPDPEARSQLIYRCGLLNVDPTPLIRRLADEPDVSARRALILTLGEFTADRLPADVRGPLIEQLVRWYRDDPDPGIHGAIDWLLRYGREGQEPRPLDWRQEAAMRKIDDDMRRKEPDGGRGWYVNREGLTMVCVRDPAVFRMGSPAPEAGRVGNEAPHRRAIGRNFAIAARPVTNREFERFRNAKLPGRLAPDASTWSPAPNGPVVGVSWFEAAQFCNWLSEKDGLDDSEWCYPTRKEDFKLGLKPFPDYLKRKGYRLPTESEWEYAARAGTGSSRYYGNSAELLPRYAWFVLNAQNRAWPAGQKRPNDLGLFDMHGNVFNWVQEPMLPYKVARSGAPTPDVEDREAVNVSPGRGIRGGAFVYPARDVRSAYRLYDNPTNHNNMTGFRPARSLP
jgi:formylglycine-generating enzyme required for sulfatase activity/tRNA A-37 threonylcarbamoyl transferase component Bud32